jgi:hypothetical protein
MGPVFRVAVIITAKIPKMVFWGISGGRRGIGVWGSIRGFWPVGWRVFWDRAGPAGTKPRRAIREKVVPENGHHVAPRIISPQGLKISPKNLLQLCSTPIGDHGKTIRFCGFRVLRGDNWSRARKFHFYKAIFLEKTRSLWVFNGIG